MKNQSVPPQMPNPTTFGKLFLNYQGFTAFAKSCTLKYTYLVKLDGRQESFISGDKLEPFIKRGVPCSITVDVVPRTKTKRQRPAVASTAPPTQPFIFDLIMMCQGQIRRHEKLIHSTATSNPTTFGKLVLNYPGFAAHAQNCGISSYTYLIRVNDGQETFVWLQELGSLVQRGVPCSITVNVVPSTERPAAVPKLPAPAFIFDLTVMCQGQTLPILPRKSIRCTGKPTTFEKLVWCYKQFGALVKTCKVGPPGYLVEVDGFQGSFDFRDKLGSFVERGVPCSITLHIMKRKRTKRPAIGPVDGGNAAVADTQPYIPPFIFDLSLKCYHNAEKPLIDKEGWIEDQEITDLGALVHTYPGFSEIANRCKMPEHLYWIYVGDHHWYSNSITFGEHQPLEGLVFRGSPVTIMVLVMPKGSSKVDPQEIPAGFRWTND